MKLPDANHGIVDRRKIMDYVLSGRHPDGRSKAEFFSSFGFSRMHWETFARALRVHGQSGTVTSLTESTYGVRYSVDGIIETPDGRNPRVRTVWMVASGNDEPRLVTAHPLRK